MTTAKKLHCGHLFHVHCLRSWLERKSSCPTCRSLIVLTESQTARNRRPQEGQFHPCQTGAGSSNGASTQGPQAGETGVNLNRHQTILQAAALVHGKLSVTHARSEAFTNVSHMNMDDVDTVERRRLSDARVTLSEHQEGLLKLSGACLNLRHQIEVEGRRFSGARASLLEAQESLLKLSEASLNLRKYIEVFKQALEFLEKLGVLKAIVRDIDS